MAEDADTKAKRRRRIKESFPPPLNEIALRHVDSVQALSESQRGMLALVLQKMGPRYLVDCLLVLRDQDVSIEDQDDLIRRLELSDKSQSANNVTSIKIQEGISEDADDLAKLLIKCYPDMPTSSAQALVASDVMSASLRVVTTTRQALEDARSDFVVNALYTLFEESLNKIKQIINSNPAFVKAIQRSRPDWNTKN